MDEDEDPDEDDWSTFGTGGEPPSPSSHQELADFEDAVRRGEVEVPPECLRPRAAPRLRVRRQRIAVHRRQVACPSVRRGDRGSGDDDPAGPGGDRAVIETVHRGGLCRSGLTAKRQSGRICARVLS